jgi:DNA-binding Lrp family transcriptional regulator
MPKELLTKRPPPKISILFEENRDALACRDILSWYAKSTATKEPIQDFDTTKVGYWLLDHHQPFIDEYSKPPDSHARISYRLQSKRPYIKNRLKELLELGLIEERGTILAEKGVVEKQLYAFTKEGCLWSWLIEARYAANEDRRSVAVNNFFGELSAFVVDFHTSFTDAFIEYVNRCTNEGLFTELDEDYFDYLLQNLFPLTQNYFRFFRFSFLAGLYTNEDMSRILIDIIEKLDEDTQALVLMQLKLDIESNYYDEMNTSKDWESHRYDNISDHTVVTLQGYCLDCKSIWPFTYGIFDFLKSGSKPWCYAPDGSIYMTTKIECPNCKKPRSRFGIPILYIPTRAFGEKRAVSPEEIEKAYDIIQNNTPRIERSSLLEREHQHIVDE